VAAEILVHARASLVLPRDRERIAALLSAAAAG
jgi:hypothetical protein